MTSYSSQRAHYSSLVFTGSDTKISNFYTSPHNRQTNWAQASSNPSKLSLKRLPTVTVPIQLLAHIGLYWKTSLIQTLYGSTKYCQLMKKLTIYSAPVSKMLILENLTGQTRFPPAAVVNINQHSARACQLAPPPHYAYKTKRLYGSTTQLQNSWPLSGPGRIK